MQTLPSRLRENRHTTSLFVLHLRWSEVIKYWCWYLQQIPSLYWIQKCGEKMSSGMLVKPHPPPKSPRNWHLHVSRCQFLREAERVNLCLFVVAVDMESTWGSPVAKYCLYKSRNNSSVDKKYIYLNWCQGQTHLLPFFFMFSSSVVIDSKLNIFVHWTDGQNWRIFTERMLHFIFECEFRIKVYSLNHLLPLVSSVSVDLWSSD